MGGSAVVNDIWKGGQHGPGGGGGGGEGDCQSSPS